MPDTAPPTGTIDITNLVEQMRQSFVSWAVLYLFGLEASIPGMEWVALPVLSTIDKEILQVILDALSKSGIMMAFFLNTAVKKASQAKDFTDAANALDGLPPTATDEEYENAERNKILAFRNFVMLSN